MSDVFDLEKFHERAAKFAHLILDDLESKGFAIDSHFSAVDHICYRVASLASYEDWKVDWMPHATILSEAFINGRPIATLKLDEPIVVNEKISIDLLELPAPKLNQHYDEGFEHIECVTAKELEALVSENSHISFKTSNIDNKFNADISLALKSGVVKFHNSSLEQVIELEQAAIGKKGIRKVVLFDFDDTLVNSKKIFIDCFYKAVCKYLGEEITIEDFIAKARPTFPEFFANYGVTDKGEIQKGLEFFKETWRTAINDVEIPVGIDSLMSCLNSEGFEISIWTARDLDTTLEFLEAHKIGSFVKNVFAYSAETVSKPEPLDELKEYIDGAKVYMIGDSDSDLHGAKNIDANFVQAGWVHMKDLRCDNIAVAVKPLDCLNYILD